MSSPSLPHGAFFVDENQPKTRNLFVWGIVILAVFGTITTIISTIFYKTRDRQIEEEILRPSSKELDLLRAKENEKLHTYGFIDQQKMIVHIPIEEAMKKEVEAAAQRTYP